MQTCITLKTSWQVRYHHGHLAHKMNALIYQYYCQTPETSSCMRVSTQPQDLIGRSFFWKVFFYVCVFYSLVACSITVAAFYFRFVCLGRCLLFLLLFLHCLLFLLLMVFAFLVFWLLLPHFLLVLLLLILAFPALFSFAVFRAFCFF